MQIKITSQKDLDKLFKIGLEGYRGYGTTELTKSQLQYIFTKSGEVLLHDCSVTDLVTVTQKDRGYKRPWHDICLQSQEYYISLCRKDPYQLPWLKTLNGV